MFTEDRALWLYQHYLWIEESLPARGNSTRSLITPTRHFYPDPFKPNHDAAVRVFERTRELMEMSDWACTLAQQLEPNQDINEALRYGGVYGESSKEGPAGTFSVSDSVEITYAPDQLNNPIALIATLAHELSHYLLATVQSEPPAGWEELEPLTDLTAVVEGFGIFLSNSAFHFSGYSDGLMQGWSSGKQGYLSEAELGFSLGIFCIRNDIDPKLAADHLKVNPREVFVDSLDFIEELEK